MVGVAGELREHGVPGGRRRELVRHEWRGRRGRRGRRCRWARRARLLQAAERGELAALLVGQATLAVPLEVPRLQTVVTEVIPRCTCCPRCSEVARR